MIPYPLIQKAELCVAKLIVLALYIYFVLKETVRWTGVYCALFYGLGFGFHFGFGLRM